MRGLEQLFDIANDYARGRVKWQTEDGKAVPVTLKQRQMWARITAYIAQVINTVRRARSRPPNVMYHNYSLK